MLRYEYRQVRYPSPEWLVLVCLGWTTAEVTGTTAIMMREIHIAVSGFTSGPVNHQ